MSFDTPTRNRLAKLVGDIRTLLTDEFLEQCQSVFGIGASGNVTSLEHLGHLDDAERMTATLLRERVTYLVRTHADEKDPTTNAVTQLVREQAFTVLNRFAALRMAEKRGLVSESVGRGYQSKGFKVFETVARTGLGDTYHRYRQYLFCLFDELALDLGVLFDRRSPQGMLFPREPVLLECLTLINAADVDALWAEDETIGWIYQYYNDPSERKKMREESPAPRNTRELAVRNQFFTPRYVVAFLTDNTLGRIWYEMTRGTTRLAIQCRYLVRRQTEIFLADPRFAFDRIFGKPEGDTYDPIPSVFRGSLADVPSDDGPESRWVSVAIPPSEIEKITGEPYQPLENDRLGRLIDDIVAGCHNPDAQDLAMVWAACSRFSLNDGGGAYSREPWQKLWAHFSRLTQQSATDDRSAEEAVRQPAFVAHRPLKDPREIRILDPACGSMHFGLYAFDLLQLVYDEAWEIARGGNNEQTLPPSFSSFIAFIAQYPDKSAFLADVPCLIIEHNLHGIDVDPRAAQIAGLSLWLRAQRVWQEQGLGPGKRPRIRRSNIVCAEPMPGDETFLNEFIETHLADPERKLLGQLVRRVFSAMDLAGEAGSLLKIEEQIAAAVSDAKREWLAGPKLQQPRLFADDASPKQQALRFDVTGITDETFWENAEERIYSALNAYAEQAERGGGYQRRLFANDAARGFAFIDVCRKRYDAVLMNPPYGVPTVKTRQYVDDHYSETRNDIYACFLKRGVDWLGATGRIGALTSRTFLEIGALEALRRVLSAGKSTLDSAIDLGPAVLDGATVETAAFTAGPMPDSQPSVFISLLREATEEKERILGRVLQQLTLGRSDTNLFLRFLSLFSVLPKRPFAYAAPKRIIGLFKTFPRLEPVYADVVAGLTTSDNDRFLRLFWEVQRQNGSWIPFVKGGGGRKFYSDSELVIAWRDNGSEIKQFARQKYGTETRTIQSQSFYFKQGLTYSRVAKTFAARVLASGQIFAEKGIGVFPKEVDPVFLLGILNSSIALACFRVFTNNRFWECATVGNMPLPQGSKFNDDIEQLTRQAIDDTRRRYQSIETSPLFSATAPTIQTNGPELIVDREERLNQLVAAAYDFDAAALEELRVFLNVPVTDDSQTESANDDSAIDDRKDRCSLTADLVSVVVGVVFGRWDVRFLANEQPRPALPDAFEPIPVCPPGQLQNKQGFPVTMEEATTLRQEGRWNYPIEVPWEGILSDDPGHPMDIEVRLHRALQVIWKDRWEAVDREACEILSVPTLRDYIRKPSGFFADHLKRYSKSRRQAPIYWPLSSANGSYTIWIYYHRLTDQTLHIALADFVDPKIRVTERAEVDARAANRSQEADDLADLLSELRGFRAELVRIIGLPWNPNLNDGVLITASPLWRLFRLSKWQKDLKACWQSVEKGAYDWAHLALCIWPDRVKAACETDRSIAIAHGLEHLCKEPIPAQRSTRGNSRRQADR